jgi:cholesterol transport system auxiliary component
MSKRNALSNAQLGRVSDMEMSRLSLSGIARQVRLTDTNAKRSPPKIAGRFRVASWRSLFRTGFIAAALPLLLTGCLSSGGGKTVVYSPQARVEAKSEWPNVSWSLVVDRPLASDALDSTNIAVRPEPGVLQVYADAQWSDPAPDLVQTALVRGFEDSGKIASIGRRNAGLHGDYVLMLDLRQFESVYADPSRPPSAVIEVEAKLLANAGGRLLATRNFRVEAQAADKQVPQVVEAFRSAMDDLNGQVIDWTLATGQANAKAPAATH